MRNGMFLQCLSAVSLLDLRGSDAPFLTALFEPEGGTGSGVVLEVARQAEACRTLASFMSDKL